MNKLGAAAACAENCNAREGLWSTALKSVTLTSCESSLSFFIYLSSLIKLEMGFYRPPHLFSVSDFFRPETEFPDVQYVLNHQDVPPTPPLPLIKYHQPEEIKTFAGKQDGERQRGRKDDIIMKPSKYLFYCVVESVPFYCTECNAKCSDSQHTLWPEGPTVSQSPPWPAFIKDRYNGKIERESWKENRKVKEWKGTSSQHASLQKRWTCSTTYFVQ